MDTVDAINRLRITEIFFSLQGESSFVGFPTVFVRLTGCPLRCSYCDTEYAFHGGQWMNQKTILDEVEKYHPRYVTVTGGEPLAQKNCGTLLSALCDAGYHVSLETSGAVDISTVDQRVARIMDLKTPGSAECDRNLMTNIEKLSTRDQVKFVIGDRSDYDWSVAQVNEHQLLSRCEVLFSPVYNQMEAAQLAEWILADQLPVRFQLQLHKIIWGNEPGR